MTEARATSETIIVVGGGISGMTAALEAAECGRRVVLVEKSPSLGGRTAQLYRYFPKLCHPVCGLEINLRRLKASQNVRVITMAEVEAIDGAPGDYTVRLNVAPRYVNENCTACGDCAAAVQTEIPDPFNYGLRSIRAAYLPHAMAFPQRYVLDASVAGGEDGARAMAACRYGAIDLAMQPQALALKAAAVIWATGWKPYDATRIQPYGYGRFPDVLTSVEFERLADPHGPTGGRILRRSDGKPAKNIAFIQCAGSRDENHLRHCSRICCMASLKQTRYVRESGGEEARSTVYYIDIRSIDRFEDFTRSVRADASVRFVKSKVARIVEDRASGELVLHGVDTEGYHRYANRHDLVVLAIGMQPSVPAGAIPAEAIADGSGFIESPAAGSALFGAGCAAGALDVNRSVQSATAAALRAIQVVHRAARAEPVSGER